MPAPQTPRALELDSIQVWQIQMVVNHKIITFQEMPIPDSRACSTAVGLHQ